MGKSGLLLHVCCAPCAAGCVERLIAEDREVTLYFSNSNIATEEEFARRLVSVEALAGFPVAAGSRSLRSCRLAGTRRRAGGGAGEGGALPGLFRLFAGAAARRAAELGVGFATTLTVSPHKSSRVIFEAGARWEHFEPYDFKKRDGFRRSRELARQYEFYMQNFCGCEFSLR